MRVYYSTVIFCLFHFVSGDVRSVEFKSDKSEIEFGRSITDDFEPRSGDFNSDNTDVVYFDQPEDGESRENEVDYPVNNPTEVYENVESRFPTEVFLKLRNITEDSSAFRSFTQRNDVVDLQASASDNVASDRKESTEATSEAAINLRRLRDTRVPLELHDDSGIPLFAPFKHKKIDTADLSDCALQGEWKPMGVDHAHHLISQQLTVSEEVHQDPDVLQTLGTNKIPKKHIPQHHFQQEEFLKLSPGVEHINPNHLHVVQAHADVNNHFKEYEKENVDFLSPPPMPSKKPLWKKLIPKKKRKPIPQEVKDSVSESTNQHFPSQQFHAPDDFTCGKNHDHGTKFHTASFQVADDSNGQYLTDESVLIGNADTSDWDQVPEKNPNFNPWNDKYQSTIAPLQDYIHASKRASNHRYPKKDIYQDQLEEPTAHRYYHEISHVTKYPSNYGDFAEPEASGELRDDTEQPEIIRELEQISNQFQLDLEHPVRYSNPPPQELSNANFYNEDVGSQEQHHGSQEQFHGGQEQYQGGQEQYHGNLEHNASPGFHHSGYNFVNLNEPNSNKYSSAEINDRPADFHYIQKINANGPTSFVHFSTPEQIHHAPSLPEVHVPKIKKHKSKKKRPHGSYEVHEKGVDQKPFNEIFPPKKNPTQFNMRVPNFATQKPKKGKKPPKKENSNLYSTQFEYPPLRNKKIKKFRPKTKVKFNIKTQHKLRRPVTDPTLKVSTPIIRVVEVTSS